MSAQVRRIIRRSKPPPCDHPTASASNGVQSARLTGSGSKRSSPGWRRAGGFAAVRRGRCAGAAGALPHCRLQPFGRARNLARCRDARLSGSLVQRAWFVVYGPRSSCASWLRGFLGGGWSASVRAIWLDLLIALAVMVAGTRSAGCWWQAIPIGTARWCPAGLPMRGCRAPAARSCCNAVRHAGQAACRSFAAYPVQQQRAGFDPRFRAGFRLRGADADAAGAEHGRRWGRCCGCSTGKACFPISPAGLSSTARPNCSRSCWRAASGLHVGRSMAFPGQLGVLEADRHRRAPRRAGDGRGRADAGGGRPARRLCPPA
jgi:hypothetical protein